MVLVQRSKFYFSFLLFGFFLLLFCSTSNDKQNDTHIIKINLSENMEDYDSKHKINYLHPKEINRRKNIYRDIEKILNSILKNKKGENSEVEVNIMHFSNNLKVDEKEESKNRFFDFLITWSTNAVPKIPLYSQLELNYTILCNKQIFEYNFKSKEKIFYQSYGIDPLKFFIIYFILSEGFNLSFSNVVMLSFSLTLGSAYAFSDGPLADEKAYEDSLNQFKEDFKMNLEKTAQACKVEGK